MRSVRAKEIDMYRPAIFEVGTDQTDGRSIDEIQGQLLNPAWFEFEWTPGSGSVKRETAAVTSRICERLDRFAFNQVALTADHLAKLDRIAQRIVSSARTIHPITTVRVIGHTDPVGSSSYNLTLGKMRADQVAQKLRARIEALRAGASAKVELLVESRGEAEPISAVAEENRRVEVCTGVKNLSLTPLTAEEQAEFSRLIPADRARFQKLRKTIEGYSGVARREADRGSRVLLRRGAFRTVPKLLSEVIELTEITSMPAGMSLRNARPLLAGNVLFNLAFPETINQGATDRLGGSGNPTCLSASTQMLLARRFPATYVRLVIQLATTNKCTFAGGDSIGPLTFKSTSLFKSLDAVLLQTAFDTYFKTKARSISYRPGDELKVHRQVFGATRPPKKSTFGSSATLVKAFRTAFGPSGNTRMPEIINICAGNNAPCGNFNHTVVITRATGGRVFFNNPWPNEAERTTMFGTATVTVSGNGERAGEASMTQADFEGQLVTVFHN